MWDAGDFQFLLWHKKPWEWRKSNFATNSTVVTKQHYNPVTMRVHQIKKKKD